MWEIIGSPNTAYVLPKTCKETIKVISSRVLHRVAKVQMVIDWDR